jgi:hypothetical protein
MRRTALPNAAMPGRSWQPTGALAAKGTVPEKRGLQKIRPVLEHFPVKWIRFTVENAITDKARAASSDATRS